MKQKDCQIPVGNNRFICKYVLEKTKLRFVMTESACSGCTPERIEKLHQQLLARKKKVQQITKYYKDMSIAEISINFSRAMVRAAKIGFKTVGKREFIERQICCSTCGGEARCPYCGCLLGLKAKLQSERGCPSPETYKKLKKYPPRNYWSVCKEKTSVIIPARNEPDLNRTIENLQENATGEIDFIVILDGYKYDVIKRDNIRVINHLNSSGRRVSINQAAKLASGKYLFIVDAHCTMSEGWDTKLKCACDNKTIAIPVLKPLTPDWILKDSNYGFVELNRRLEEKWSEGKKIEGCKIIEETMAFTGCGWIIQKDYYYRLNGYDESLGEYGYDGPEWSLKTYLNDDCPGKVLLRTDVFCGHRFGTNKNNVLYKPTVIKQTEFYARMMDKYSNKIHNLVARFSPKSWLI